MIDSLLHSIENHLYRSEFADPQADRLTACLAVHAALLGRTDCPRVLSASARGGLRQFSETVSSLLLTPLAEVSSQTALALTLVGLASAPLGDLPPCDRAKCLELVEDILDNGWGCRTVHYEMARLSPFTTEDVARSLDRFNLRGAGSQARYVAARLRKRTAEMEEYGARFPTLSERRHQQHRWDTLRLAEARKAEEEWLELWAEPSAYVEPTREKKILSSLGRPRSG